MVGYIRNQGGKVRCPRGKETSPGENSRSLLSLASFSLKFLKHATIEVNTFVRRSSGTISLEKE